jgi:hypothetical protein
MRSRCNGSKSMKAISEFSMTEISHPTSLKSSSFVISFCRLRRRHPSSRRTVDYTFDFSRALLSPISWKDVRSPCDAWTRIRGGGWAS